MQRKPIGLTFHPLIWHYDLLELTNSSKSTGSYLQGCSYVKTRITYIKIQNEYLKRTCYAQALITHGMSLPNVILIYYYYQPINHRKKLFLRYYLSSAGCLYVCNYDCSHTVQPQLLNSGTTFLMYLSKRVFSFIYFFAQLLTFFYTSLRFLFKFEEQFRKNRGGRNDFI